MFQSFARNVGGGSRTEARSNTRLGPKPEDVNPCPNTEAGNRNSRRVVGVAPLMNSNVIANVMARKF